MFGRHIRVPQSELRRLGMLIFRVVVATLNRGTSDRWGGGEPCFVRAGRLEGVHVFIEAVGRLLFLPLLHFPIFPGLQ